MLPANVVKELADPVFQRQDPKEVTDAIARLGVQPGETFIEFYRSYIGAFGSRVTGFGLLDISSGDENILVSTELCRKKYQFPQRYLVISGLLGGSVLVYDVMTDAVLNIDFEGGDKDLISGTATPEWKTFFDFLEGFFRVAKSKHEP
jgi:hypothetical protein